MKNNRGSSLILVIICIAFAGILGTTVLVNSTANRDMKLVDGMAKENFYQTESGLDIFLANLSYMSEEVMKDAYAHVLTHFKDNNLKREVKENLFYELTGTAYSDNAEALVKKELLEKKDGSLKGTLFDGVDPNIFGTELRLLNSDSLKAVVDGDDIVLKGLSVQYQENGYETKITTDVRVKIECTMLNVETPVTVSGKFMDYSIITDKNLLVMESGSTVSGNVYAGNSVVADNMGKFTLRAAKLIAGSSVRTERGGSVDISGLSGQVEVWTNNILTVRDITSAVQSIQIKGADCYVADDMTIGAKNSVVSITGNYYGYTMVGGGVTAADSSAIVINSGKSTLDLSGLNTLWLAGRASLKVPNIYGGDTSVSAYREIVEGETISYRGNQVAYLVPGECIRKHGHNPLTKAELDELGGNIVDTSVEFGTNGKMTLAEYVATVPCEVVPVLFLTEETEPLYYIYLKFKTAVKAQEYFKRYSEVNEGQLNDYAEVLELGEVKLPADEKKIQTSGTVLRVNDRHQITDVICRTIDSEAAFKKQSELKQKFSGLVAMLDENFNGVPGGSLVSSIIRMSEVTEAEVHLYFDKDMKKVDKRDSDGYEVIVKKGDIELKQKNFRGIVIADGKITVEGGTFTGMMLATGNITIKNATLMAAASGTDAFSMKELIDKNSSIQRYFESYPLPSGNGDGEGEKEAAARNIAVSYENWIKN